MSHERGANKQIHRLGRYLYDIIMFIWYYAVILVGLTVFMSLPEIWVALFG